MNHDYELVSLSPEERQDLDLEIHNITYESSLSRMGLIVHKLGKIASRALEDIGKTPLASSHFIGPPTYIPRGLIIN